MGGMLKVLEGFHHFLERRITVMTARYKMSREWECPLVYEALETAVIWSIKEYIKRRQDTVAS